MILLFVHTGYLTLGMVALFAGVLIPACLMDWVFRYNTKEQTRQGGIATIVAAIVCAVCLVSMYVWFHKIGGIPQ